MSIFNLDLTPHTIPINEGMDDDNDTPDYTKDNDAGDNAGDDGNTDYTIPDDDGSGENSDTMQPAEDNDNDEPDYTKDDDDAVNSPNEGGDEGDDSDVDNMDDNDDSDSDNANDGSYTDDEPSSDDPIKGLQRDIFSNLSDEQMLIKDKELRRRYFNMYESIDGFIERINEIPESANVIRYVEFVSIKLEELSNMLNDYITHTYDTLTYVENEVNYNKFFAILSGISSVIQDIGEMNKK